MKMETYKIVIDTEKNASIMVRLLQIFTRRRIAIDGIEAMSLPQADMQQVNIVLTTTQEIIQRLIPQIEKQIEVFKATYTKEN